MSSKLKVLQVIPKLGYGGAETGCYDLAHFLPEKGCKSYVMTSGGELLKYIDKKKVKVTKDGYFAFGLGRDRKNDIVIKIHENGSTKIITKKIISLKQDVNLPDFGRR